MKMNSYRNGEFSPKTVMLCVTEYTVQFVMLKTVAATSTNPAKNNDA